ncbi:hypothetical protein ROS62_30125 [Streptomyces sp. DSM 41972]|uniref:Uncharacterized protein n=1 Tax=Streptomyces althioticus subsp. attaecolombicae TaxID=3075534 RepID=A0ABU3I7E7_9ACTN|nr:hypothetical protein [Streptomyces sp. DSM 41972]SCE54556.1 hypothetical protein GA0115245_14802 [Streptomyces sp. di188]
MKKHTLEYEQALDAVADILRERARTGAAPLTYGDLSLKFNLQLRTSCRTASLTWGFAGQADGLRVILRSAKESDSYEGRRGECAGERCPA